MQTIDDRLNEFELNREYNVTVKCEFGGRTKGTATRKDDKGTPVIEFVTEGEYVVPFDIVTAFVEYDIKRV